VSAAELSMKEIQEKEAALQKELPKQKATFGFSVDALAELPSPAEVAKAPLIASLPVHVCVDIKRPFRLPWCACGQAGFGPWVFACFGLCAPGT